MRKPIKYTATMSFDFYAESDEHANELVEGRFKRFRDPGLAEYEGRENMQCRVEQAGTGQSQLGQLQTFAVRRPYCSPEHVLIVARSASEASALSNLCFGFASGTVALRP